MTNYIWSFRELVREGDRGVEILYLLISWMDYPRWHYYFPQLYSSWILSWTICYSYFFVISTLRTPNPSSLLPHSNQLPRSNVNLSSLHKTTRYRIIPLLSFVTIPYIKFLLSSLLRLTRTVFLHYLQTPLPIRFMEHIYDLCVTYIRNFVVCDIGYYVLCW